MNIALHEILSTQVWNMLPTALHAYRNVITENMTSRKSYIPEENRLESMYLLSSNNTFSEKVIVEKAELVKLLDKVDADDKIICVTNINGPILRNGGVCSYGSIEQKENMMNLSSKKNVVGHILVINSPGGSAYSLYDYEDAIMDAKNKGKAVVAFVKGMACSAGYAAAMMCDEIYCFGEHDQIGCIGSMLATYLNKPGDVNSITQEKYVEIYAKDSPYKNREFRAAENGDYSQWQKMVDESCESFHEAVSKYRPNVTLEQKKGDTYDAIDVVGTMIDGFGTMQTCVSRVLDIYGERLLENRKKGTSYTDKDVNSINRNIEQKMGKEYASIQSALELNALVSDKEGGLYFTESLADRMNDFASDAFQTKNTLNAKLEEIKKLNEKISMMQQDHEEVVSKLKSSHSKDIEELKASFSRESGEEIGKLQEEVNDLKSKLEESNNLLKEKENEIKELSDTTQDPPSPEDGVKENGTGTSSGRCDGVVFSDMKNLTLEEKQRKYHERMSYLGGL